MAGQMWHQTELDFIKKNFGEISYDDMAKLLNRTKRAVLHKCQQLGFQRDDLLLKEGDKIERLTIKKIFFQQLKKQKKRYAECLCECGNTTIVRLTDIQNRRIKSCSCLKNELAKQRTIERNYKHGRSNMKVNRLYRIWANMRCRCSNSNIPLYHRYGGRGISVCEEWQDYMTFEKWAFANGYKDSLSIDRIDNNGNYHPSNCRWATHKEQAANTEAANRINSHFVTAFGERKSIRDWVKDDRCNINSVTTLGYRLGVGWPAERAITTPSERGGNKVAK